MEQIAKYILKLKNILLGMKQTKGTEMSENREADIEQLEKTIKELEQLYNDSSISVDEKKTKLITYIAQAENNLAFKNYYPEMHILTQAEFEFDINTINDGDCSLKQKQELLLSAKQKYQKMKILSLKLDVNIDFITAQEQIGEAIINVIGSKLSQGISVDFENEIEKEFYEGITSVAMEKLSALINDDKSDKTELASKLFRQLQKMNLEGSRGENLTILYSKEFWSEYFKCTGIIWQTEKQENTELKEQEKEETFAEYRKRKIEEYKQLTGRDDIEPGERQITIIDKFGNVVKLNVDEDGKATGTITDQNNNQIRVPIYRYTDGESVIKRKRSDGSFNIVELREKKEKLAHIFGDSVAAIFGCGIKKFRSNLLLHMDIQDVILNEDIEEIGGRYLEYCKGSYKERNWVSFRMKNLIKEIRFPPNLREIHEGSFLHCIALENVIIDPRCNNNDRNIERVLLCMQKCREKESENEPTDGKLVDNPKIIAGMIRKKKKELENLRNSYIKQQRRDK